MTANQESVNISSFTYTPVYFVQNPRFAQPNTFTVARSVQDEHKPIGDTLRKFYENSGNLENSVFLNNVDETLKPITLTKEPEIQTFKLSSLIKPDTIYEQHNVPGKNIILSSTAPLNSNTFAVCTNPNQVINIDRKIIKLDPDRSFLKKHSRVKSLQRIKPKEENMKPLSVNLLKFGNTYRCVNELNTYQKKIVNQGVKKLKDTENVPSQPTYDPVTKRHFIYKVIPPKELTVVGNKVTKEKTYETKKENMKNETKKGNVEITDECTETVEPKVTRSGRKVKSPKHCLSELPTVKKTKRHTSVQCIKCSHEFVNIYALNKHYEKHIQENTHKNLFQFLLSIIKNSCDEDKANIFIKQLDVFIEELKLIVPCVTKKTDGIENPCFISDNVSRLLGINPGQQKFDMEGINCVKDKDGYCKHNPQKNKQFNSDISKPSQLWLSKHNEEIANIEIEAENCARTHPIEKWPKFNNQVWKYKKKCANAKKMRLSSENVDTIIELDNEQSTVLTSDECAILETKSTVTANQSDLIQDHSNQKEVIETSNNSVKPKFVQAQYHSNHFDIHSSPIKPTPGVYQKFQIASDKISPVSMKIIKPLALNRKVEEVCNVPKNSLLRTFHNENQSSVTDTYNDDNIHFNDTISVLNLDNCQKDTDDSDKNVANTTQYLNAPSNPVASNSGQSLNNILDTLLEDILDLNDFC